MKILVINAGSSSLKFQLIDMDDESVKAKGLVERIGIEGTHFKQTVLGTDKVIEFTRNMKDHTEAISAVLSALTDKDNGAIASLDEIGACGHRVLHGGETFKNSVLVTEETMKGIEDLVPLGPLHQPAKLPLKALPFLRREPLQQPVVVFIFQCRHIVLDMDGLLCGMDQLGPAVPGVRAAAEIALLLQPVYVDGHQVCFQAPDLHNIPGGFVCGIIGKEHEDIKGGLRDALLPAKDLAGFVIAAQKLLEQFEVRVHFRFTSFKFELFKLEEMVARRRSSVKTQNVNFFHCICRTSVLQ